MRLSLIHATTWQMRGAVSTPATTPSRSPVPPPTGSALLCYLAEVQGPLSLLLQLVMGRTISPTLKTQGHLSHESQAVRGGGWERASLSRPLHHMVWVCRAKISQGTFWPDHLQPHQLGQLYCVVQVRCKAHSPKCCSW